jgi:hypothetical protein
MELYIPITVTTKYEKNPPPYFFMFDSHRFCLAIYSYGVEMQSLLVSFHGPNTAIGLTNIEKPKNIEHYLTFFDKVRVAHSCQTMIVAGDFNIKYSAIQSDCKTLLEKLNLTVMEYDLEIVPEDKRTETHYGHHRAQNPLASGGGRKKEKVDTIIHSNSILVVGNAIVDKDIPADIMDHHPILATLRLPQRQTDRQLGGERKRKAEKEEESARNIKTNRHRDRHKNLNAGKQEERNMKFNDSPRATQRGREQDQERGHHQYRQSRQKYYSEQRKDYSRHHHHEPDPNSEYCQPFQARDGKRPDSQRRQSYRPSHNQPQSQPRHPNHSDRSRHGSHSQRDVHERRGHRSQPQEEQHYQEQHHIEPTNIEGEKVPRHTDRHKDREKGREKDREKYKEKDRERHRETDRQRRDRQRDRQRERQRKRQIERQRERQRKRQRERKRQTERQRHRGTETERQRDRETG